jgi:hypothetical protein
VVRALGGFGKSALCWQWLTHDVDPAQFSRVVWWSFYEGDASFDSFTVIANFPVPEYATMRSTMHAP